MISRQSLSLGLSNFQKFYFVTFPGFMTKTYSSKTYILLQSMQNEGGRTSLNGILVPTT